MRPLAVVLLACATATFAQAYPQGYKSVPGPAPIETRELLLHDAHRNKELPLRVLYPREISGRTPVIIFSHGAGGSKDSYSGLTRHWASYGYIVLQPTHSDSVQLRRSTGDSNAGMLQALQTALHDEDAWRNRPLDISLVIDSFDEIERDVPALRGKLDRDHVGVAGHSFGGFTAESSACATVQLRSESHALDLHDKRIKAALVLSGEGPGQMGLTDSSFKHCNLPMMSMTGTRDRAANGWTPEWREQLFTLSPAPDKYFLNLNGANHFTFVGRQSPEADPAPGNAGVSPAGAAAPRRRGFILRSSPNDEARIFGYVQVASTAFWDAYLMRDAAALDYLRSNSLPRYASNQLRYERK
jgi:predicted dienelactone hydrolase